jgi:hypothetical protein
MWLQYQFCAWRKDIACSRRSFPAVRCSTMNGWCMLCDDDRQMDCCGKYRCTHNSPNNQPSWWKCEDCGSVYCFDEECLHAIIIQTHKEQRFPHYYCCCGAARDLLSAVDKLATSCCGKTNTDDILRRWKCTLCKQAYCEDPDCLAKISNYRTPNVGKCCAKSALYNPSNDRDYDD